MNRISRSPRLKELKLADLQIFSLSDLRSLPFSIEDFQHLFSFAKNFHMSIVEKTVSFLLVLFWCCEGSNMLSSQIFTRCSFFSLGECFIGILQSLFKKVQLEFHVSGNTQQQSWLFFKMVASAKGRKKRFMYSEEFKLFRLFFA